MKEHYIVSADRGQLRIYSETKPCGEQVGRLHRVDSGASTSVDAGYVDQQLDRGAAFREAGGHPEGATFDETFAASLPDDAPRSPRQIATELDGFLRKRPGASWDLATSPTFYAAVIEAVSPEVRRRLKRVLSPDRLKRHVEEARVDFAGARW